MYVIENTKKYAYVRERTLSGGCFWLQLTAAFASSREAAERAILTSDTDVPKPLDYRELARRWRNSSKARCLKLGRTVELPSIDEVHEYLEASPKVCEYCQTPLGPFKYNRPNMDHRQPLSRGGTAGTDNLALTCGPCDRAKGAMLKTEYLALRSLVAGWADGGKDLFIRLRMGFYR